MNFTLAELTRINLVPGEVLVVKLYGDDYDDTDTAEFQKHLQTIFPNNVVQMIVLPVGKDLQMEVISAKLEDKKSTELAPDQIAHEAQKQELMDKLNALNEKFKEHEENKKSAIERQLGLKNDCSVSYCNDCSCGKKALAEANDEITESKS